MNFIKKYFTQKFYLVSNVLVFFKVYVLFVGEERICNSLYWQ